MRVVAVLSLAVALGIPVADGPVVLLGDSIFSRVPPVRGNVDMGISGALMRTIANEAQKIPHDTAAVVLEGGLNDFLNNTAADIPASYADALEAIEHQAPKAKIMLLGILPVNESQLAHNRDFLAFVDNEKIAAMNERIFALCRHSCSVVRQPFGDSIPEEATVGDGIHPNAIGYGQLVRSLGF